MKNVIPKAAPATTIEAYGRLQDLSDAVGALRVAGMSDVHSLQLPPEAITALIAAHEALKEAHRLVEAKLSSYVILRPYEAGLTGGPEAPSLAAVAPEGTKR